MADSEQATDMETRDSLADLCQGLNEQERTIIVLYYRDGLTQFEIGLTLRLSESRISQMHKELLQRLRKRQSAVA